MKSRSDSELLTEYTERGTEAAFAELVQRHIGLVYSTALRLTMNPHLAEDITQAVFIALARNASALRRRRVLSGWLHLTTRNIAAKTVRSEVRRRAREQEAAAMPSSSPDPETVWSTLAPHLDDALAELNEADRDALMLRFFERKTAREIGERLGLGEEAAQKRIERALTRLRSIVASRGLSISDAALAGALLLPGAHAAPAGLAAAITAQALAEVAEISALHPSYEALAWSAVASLGDQEIPRDRLLSAILELPDGKLRTDTLARTLDNWRRSGGGHEVSQWLNSVHLDRPVAARIEERMAMTEYFEGDRLAVADWLVARAQTSEERSRRMERLVGNWALDDPVACARWLNAQGLDATAARAMGTYAFAIAASHPADAVAWVRDIPDATVRRSAFDRVAKRIRQHHPHRAESLLAAP